MVIIMYRCCFAGHSNIDQSQVIEKLKIEILNMLKATDDIEFWVGNYGAFDRIVSNVLLEIKSYNNIKTVLVIPYITKDIQEHRTFYLDRFDEIIIAPTKDSTPNRYKIIECNKYMISNSDCLICYINHTWGGAYKTYEYALKKDIKIINIS